MFEWSCCSNFTKKRYRWCSETKEQCKTCSTRMWADAQRNGCPAEYRWRPLRKFCNSISCVTPHLLMPTARVPCSNAAKIGECKSWMQSEFCTWQNSVTGQERWKMYIYIVPLQELVSWSLTSLFSTNIAISETNGHSL